MPQINARLRIAHDSIVAEVVEISLEPRGVRVYEVYCAADCGTLLNPDSVEVQMQGAVSFGEAGTPPIALAVANAVFAATGTPVRRLPIRV